MAVASAALSRGAGRVSRRLDRLSEHKFALLVSIPGLILVALIVLPPTLAVFGLSLFRIELGKDDLIRFVGLNNYLVRLPIDRRGPRRRSRGRCSSRRCQHGRHAAPRAGDRARPQSRFRGVGDLLHGAAAAVGDRVGRGRHLLAVHLRYPLRDRERRPGRARRHRRSRSTGSRTRPRPWRSRSSRRRGGRCRCWRSCCWPR